jgi:hypothetical protein
MTSQEGTVKFKELLYKMSFLNSVNYILLTRLAEEIEDNFITLLHFFASYLSKIMV